MTTLLVANRGEIAVRIMRTAALMGMRTVAVFSDADAGSPHVRAADISRCIGSAAASDSYLRADRILEAAEDAGADLIHPGYGFLAEDDRFAEACEKAGIIFVGPPSAVLAQVGDKIAVRGLAADAGVPLLPAYASEDQSDAAFADAAAEIGFPVLVKPSAGGGGKGMSVVHAGDDLAAVLASSRRIAMAAFGDDRLLIERYLQSPRHVEVQIIADAFGRVLHLGERDCSLQRRHQKLLEESPAPNLAPESRRRVREAAVALATRANYVGAGTCEFLIGSDDTIGFIEVNARLQVEHPVTELVTGLDLVELQLRVALGERLRLAQEDVKTHGHAIEVRVYAEDPDAGSLPQAGRIEHIRWPRDARVDTGIEESTVVTTDYDPLLAKIIVGGEDRNAAIDALPVALSQAEILGVRTNLSFLAALVRDDAVVNGCVTTDWLESAYEPRTSPDTDFPLLIAAAAEADRILATRERDPWAQLGPWRAGGAGALRTVLRCPPDGPERVVSVDGTGPFVADGVRVGRGNGCHDWWVSVPETAGAAAYRDGVWLVWWGGAHEIAVGVPARRSGGAAPARLDSPLPGQVVAVMVEPGQAVAEGDGLVVVEAMKMEHTIRAPSEGVVRAVLCAPGDRVDRGRPLVDMETPVE